MKIIDLLNWFRDKNKIPTRIKVKHGMVWDYYKWDVAEQWYVTLDNSTLLRVACPKDLLEEVEILEEEKKIPEKVDYCKEHLFDNNKTSYLSMEERRLLDSKFKEIGNKINSIIDYLKSKGE